MRPGNNGGYGSRGAPGLACGSEEQQGGGGGVTGSKGSVGRTGGGRVQHKVSSKEQRGRVRGGSGAQAVQALEGFTGKKPRLCLLGSEEAAVSHLHFSMNLSQDVAFRRLIFMFHLVLIVE